MRRKNALSRNVFTFIGKPGKYAALESGELIGFISLNSKAKIQCKTDGTWLTGHRWMLQTKDGVELDNLPLTRLQAAKLLKQYDHGMRLRTILKAVK